MTKETKTLAEKIAEADLRGSQRQGREALRQRTILAGSFQQAAREHVMTKLRKLIEAASNDVDTYKRHNPEKAREWINKLLKAGNLGGIGEDRIEYIRFYSGKVEIGTSYSVRNCAQTAEHSFPERVLDSDDPIAAIKVWAWGERVADAEQGVKRAKADLQRAEERLLEAMSS